MLFYSENTLSEQNDPYTEDSEDDDDIRKRKASIKENIDIVIFIGASCLTIVLAIFLGDMGTFGFKSTNKQLLDLLNLQIDQD